MSIYMVLYSFTDEGVKAPQQVLDGANQVHETVEQMGGKVIACYALMGEYDAVGIYEIPGDEDAFALLLSIGANGLARTKTFKAFSLETFAASIRRIAR